MMPLLLAALLAQEMVFVVRHAEKADTSKDAALSEQGRERADKLAQKMRNAGITAIYTTEYIRTKDTAKPLAQALKVEPQVHPAKDSAGLVELLRREHPKDRVLIVGHSNTLPEIAAAYGVKNKVEIADDEYDALLVIVPASHAMVRLRQ